MLICPKCKREVNAWPLRRGAICSPPTWVRCIRNDGEFYFSHDLDGTTAMRQIDASKEDAYAE